MTINYNRILHFEEIPIGLRTANIGTYNRMVYICPECDNDMCDRNFEKAVGFGSKPPGVVMVVECDKCGERFHSHAGVSTYHCYLDTQERVTGIRPAPLMEAQDENG